MSDKMLSQTELELVRQNRALAVKIAELVGNPLSADEVAMFEMFEREAWSHEKRRAHLIARALGGSSGGS